MKFSLNCDLILFYKFKGLEKTFLNVNGGIKRKCLE